MMGLVRDGERTARQYDAMGAGYGAGNEGGSFNAYYERPATIALLGEVKGLRVLEAGCGPGVLTGWLAGNGAAVTAMDVSPEMVRLARDRVGDRARVVVGDLSEPLTFAADASVDLVVASLVLHYLADWAGPLAEFHRVLAPRGAVVFSTHHPAMDWQLHSPEDYFAVKQVTEAWTRDGESFDVTFWRRPLTAMTEAISGAGFVIDQLVEPAPAAELRRRDPKNHDKIAMSPRFLFFRLVKRSFTPNA
jgi:SAM-dependent methyltransferase